MNGWLRQRERGTLGAIRLIAWLTRHGGYPIGRALLHPICLYFVLFSVPARRSSRAYLARVLGRRPRWRDVYRHYHTFAGSLLDRVEFLSGRMDRFEVALTGADVLHDALQAGRGCLLLGSHLGSFELVRVLAASQPGLIVNVVMHEANAGKMAQWTRESSSTGEPRVIPPGQLDTMLRVRECLRRGEIVAMLGDRPLGRTSTLPVEVLGTTARIPDGPFRLALALGVPVVLFFGLFRGPRRYDVRFERLDCSVEASRSDRLGQLATRYGDRLSSYARETPFNWFNFYDYWETT